MMALWDARAVTADDLGITACFLLVGIALIGGAIVGEIADAKDKILSALKDRDKTK